MADWPLTHMPNPALVRTVRLRRPAAQLIRSALQVASIAYPASVAHRSFCMYPMRGANLLRSGEEPTEHP